MRLLKRALEDDKRLHVLQFFGANNMLKIF